MTLREKYSEVLNTAGKEGVKNLEVMEKDNVLYINGHAPSEAAKKKVWDQYEKLNPEYRSSDLILNLTSPEIKSDMKDKEYVVEQGDNLSSIGKKIGISWKDIYAANKDKIKDPNHIEPGWKLKIPVPG